MSKILIIGGPTASGKTKLALKLAKETPSVIINADSQQIYKEIPIITAQPSKADMKKVPHRLFGFMSARQRCSAGIWLHAAEQEITKAREESKRPIIVGGTGMYIKCLVYGVAAIPDIALEVRNKAKALLEEIGSLKLHDMLSKKDVETAARLHPQDSQRILRAWEVLEQTEKSISEWQNQKHEALYDKDEFEGYFLNPPREELYKNCDLRFDKMLKQGALKEVSKLHDMQLEKTLPAMSALGVPELISHLNGTVSLDAARDTAKKVTRNFAKRQVTWFRHQLPLLEEITGA